MNTTEDTFAALYGLRPIRNTVEGRLIPVDEFRLAAISYTFVNGDGIGYWATKKHYLSPSLRDYEPPTSSWARPSDFLKEGFKPPYWATHVLWYNK